MTQEQKILHKWAETYGDDKYDVKASMYSPELMIEFAKYYHIEVNDLCLSHVRNRYDNLVFKKPFRVGRKQGKSVLDANGLLVTFFEHSKEQATLFCNYLNNDC